MTAPKQPILLAAALALLMALRPAIAVPTPDDDRALKVKAGMVLNFIRYTEWPADAFASDRDPLVLIAVGDGDVADHLAQTMGGQSVHGRAVEVRRLSYPKPGPGESEVPGERMREFAGQIRAAHALFICDSERDRLTPIFEGLDRSAVLTVSDIPDFAERGGMLGLVIRKERIAFDANPDSVQAARLKVSSQLLRLARTVKSRKP